MGFAVDANIHVVIAHHLRYVYPVCQDIITAEAVSHNAQHPLI